MRRRNDAGKIWLYICRNCVSSEQEFAGSYTAVWKDTLKYIIGVDNVVDRFSLALMTKDKEAIDALYKTIDLNAYQKELLNELLERNNELLYTLNPFVLDPKYDFLMPVIDELVVDKIIQDKLLSLNEYELSILKRITEYCISYGVNPNRIISLIITNMGCSIVPGRNSEELLNKEEKFLKLLQDYEENGGLINDEMIANIAIILKTGICIPEVIDELINYNQVLKDLLKEQIEDEELDFSELKENLMWILFSIKLREVKYFINAFNVDGAGKEDYTSHGFIELLAMKMLYETEDVDKLKEIAREIINNPYYKINLFNNNLIEENLLLIYARAFNKCRPNFDNSNIIRSVDGINFYDAGVDFYAIGKVLGAFSCDGRNDVNYCEEWNDNRYRSHVNAVSLIRNDNLAFAEQDGKLHVKLGFLDFDEKMLLGGGVKDVNSTPDSIDMSVKIYSKLYYPSEFVDNTREWHNELDYERKDSSITAKHFKKNPDYIIIDQEVEDINFLSEDKKREYEELVNMSIKAAKDFGNIPILVINREKIAKHEMDVIRRKLDEYYVTYDFLLLKRIITRLNNNRNGCRGVQHKYIREKYFSNTYYQQIFSEIDGIILEEHRSKLEELIDSEIKKMARCVYDDTTLDLPHELKQNGSELSAKKD
ncbi:MAG TPA: hypothetical protein DCE23_09920 [Firmicutes bacterium]|nr:hypothetical protein [Bacillota bacterium]